MDGYRAQPRWVIDLLVGCVCATFVWAVFLEDFGPADLWVFLHAARSIGHGASPYVDPSSPLVWSGHTYVYPYVTAWMFLPLSWLSFAAAGVVYYVLSVGAMILGVRLVVGSQGGLVPVVVALTAEPVVRALQLGTLNAWLFLGTRRRLAVPPAYRSGRGGIERGDRGQAVPAADGRLAGAHQTMARSCADGRDSASPPCWPVA